MIRRVALFAALAALVAGLAAPPVGAQPRAVYPVGTMKPLPQPLEPCPVAYDCTSHRVTIPGLRQRDQVTIAVAPPFGPPAGTVVFLTGSTGTDWWDNGHERLVTEFVTGLRQRGKQVVQVRWQRGWLVAPGAEPVGPHVLGARPATVLQHVYDTVAAGQRLTVTGHSGGASQLAYALTFYGLDGIVDRAVFTSGPPHAAIERGCLRQPGDEAYWYDADDLPTLDMSWGSGDSTGPCATHDPGFTEAWMAASVEAGPDLVWPRTDAYFLLGTRDETGCPEHASDFIAAAMPASLTVEWIDTTHKIATATGLLALDAALG